MVINYFTVNNSKLGKKNENNVKSLPTVFDTDALAQLFASARLAKNVYPWEMMQSWPLSVN